MEVNQEVPKFRNSSLSLPPILDTVDIIPMNKLLTELRKVQSPQLTFLEQYGFWGLPGLILIVLVIIIIVVWVNNCRGWIYVVNKRSSTHSDSVSFLQIIIFHYTITVICSEVVKTATMLHLPSPPAQNTIYPSPVSPSNN